MIREVLEETKTSGVDFAQMVEIHRVTLSRYLNGKIDVSGDTLIKMLNKTGYGITAIDTSILLNRPMKEKKMHITKDQAYPEVIQLCQAIGGTMEWFPKPPGGYWRLTLENKSFDIDIKKLGPINDLDRLYSICDGITNPTSQDHYSYVLRDDAVSKLRELFVLKAR